MATLYDVLGVPPRASQDEVRRAYYELARSLHPDHHEGVSPDPQRLHEVNEAWRVLRDPATRSSYDRSIEGRTRGRRQPYRPRHAAPDPAPPDDDDLDVPFRGRTVEPGDVGISVVRGLPWIAVALVLAVIFVFTAFAGGRDEQTGPRQLIGRCVDRTTGSGFEAVPCEGPNDGEVVLVVDRATRCREGTTPAALAGEWLCVEPPDRSGR